MTNRVLDSEHYPHLKGIRLIGDGQPMIRTQMIHQSPDGLEVNMHSETIPTYRVDIPKDDFNHILTVYKSTMACHERHPGIQQAWEQYRLMLIMAARDEQIQDTP